jgi:hypothetical protein
LNLEDDLVPTFIGGVPVDLNASGSVTGYQLYRDVDSQQGFGIVAANAELERTIVAGSAPVMGPPAEIANLVFWLDAGVGVNLNGGNVASWEDRSENAYLFEQSSSAAQPVYNATGCSDGLPAISFDGADFLEEVLTTDGYTRSNLSVFFVHRLTAQNRWATLFRFGMQGVNADNVPQLGMVDNDNRLGIHRVDYAEYNISVPYSSSPINDWYISSLQRVDFGQPSAQWEVRSNSLFSSGADWGGSDLNDYVQIGHYNEGALFGYIGDICEVIMYSEALSENDRLTIEQYLSNKYSISF